MDNMWKDYMAEEYGRSCIYSEYGFMTYSIWEGKEMLCHDFYIKKEHRGTGKGLEIAKKVLEEAKKQGCEIMSCYVDIQKWNTEYILKCYMNFGFKIHNLTGDKIVMVKKL